jgi:hypothetical protein
VIDPVSREARDRVRAAHFWGVVVGASDEQRGNPDYLEGFALRAHEVYDQVKA